MLSNRARVQELVFTAILELKYSRLASYFRYLSEKTLDAVSLSNQFKNVVLNVCVCYHCKSSLFQSLCQCGRLKKRAGDERGLQLIPLVARSLFRSSTLTERLEQVTIKSSCFFSSVVQSNLPYRHHPYTHTSLYLYVLQEVHLVSEKPEFTQSLPLYNGVCAKEVRMSTSFLECVRTRNEICIDSESLFGLDKLGLLKGSISQATELESSLIIYWKQNCRTVSQAEAEESNNHNWRLIPGTVIVWFFGFC